ncbi:type II secretion system F family protein [Nocardioides sp.]|uniref:type II secretion system F family protein n=1 Tax=Nocardioides sp. TaxID=35761 RepID=UPI002735CC45|nr:type II secretion system F family protein [Nocardioides sp.]MDP3893630.1 type II secretion system F family protein [Nocardioides sp.]
MMPLIAAVSAVCVLTGLGLLIAGLRRVPDTRATRPQGRRPRETWLNARGHAGRRNQVLGGAGLVVGLLLWLFSGWLIAIVIAPAAFVGIPLLLMTGEGARAIERLEALEEWTRSLAGVLGAGIGLEQAIQATLSRSTPAAIRPEVATLVARIRARWSTTAALRAFADDLGDATGDSIVAGLILAAERRGPGLAPMLEETAERAAEEVRNRRRVEADLAKPRSTARWVTLITVGVLGLMAFNGDYIAPYGTPLGQLFLTALLGAYVGALIWMRKMARGENIPRLLSNPQEARS